MMIERNAQHELSLTIFESFATKPDAAAILLAIVLAEQATDLAVATGKRTELCFSDIMKANESKLDAFMDYCRDRLGARSQ